MNADRANRMSTEYQEHIMVHEEPAADILIQRALRQIGWDPNEDEGTRKTPERFLKYLGEFLQGHRSDRTIMGDLFDVSDQEGSAGMIVQSGIPFRMVCEHHLLPAIGHAYVGYIPRGKVVGLSKIARLVDAVGTETPSMQEVICEKVAQRLYNYTDAMGSMVVMKATHSCMSCRGVVTPDTETSTSTIRGVFRDLPAARQEFFSLAGIK